MKLKPFQSKLTKALPRTLELEREAALIEVRRYNDSHSRKRLARVEGIIRDRADDVLAWLHEAQATALQKVGTLRATGNTGAADGWQHFADAKAARIAEIKGQIVPAGVLAAFAEATEGATEADIQMLAAEPQILADVASDRRAA